MNTHTHASTHTAPSGTHRHRGRGTIEPLANMHEHTHTHPHTVTYQVHTCPHRPSQLPHQEAGLLASFSCSLPRKPLQGGPRKE